MNGVSYFPYRLTLSAPALITAPGGDPNSARTLAYVPGSAVRGAAAAGLHRQGRSGELDELVHGGHVRYLNAYPSARGSAASLRASRAVPMPHAWRADKHPDTSGRWDLAGCPGQPEADHDGEGQWPQAPLEGPAASFVALAHPGGPVEVEVRTTGRLHNQRDRSLGRAWRGGGAVFAYEAIEEGQSFVGLLQVRGADEDRAELRGRVAKALGERLLVGRSKLAGYGGDAVLEVSPEGHPRELGGRQQLVGGCAKGAAFQLLLTAPCIARDELTGSHDPRSVLDAVERRLDRSAHVERVRWDHAAAGGFNRRWGLELPQTAAISAGSVLVMRAVKDLDQEDLLRLEHEGIGERRAEGYGRVAVLRAPAEDAASRAVVNLDSQEPLAPARPSGSPPPLVQLIERRILAARLDAHVAAEAARLTDSGRARGIPSRHLLARLREPLRHRDPMQALAGLAELLGELKKPARGSLRGWRIGQGDSGSSRRLDRWLAKVADGDILASSDEALDLLAERSEIAGADSARKALEGLLPDARRRLADGVLAGLARRARSDDRAPMDEDDASS